MTESIVQARACRKTFALSTLSTLPALDPDEREHFLNALLVIATLFAMCEISILIHPR
jgi:hypothetical protein